MQCGGWLVIIEGVVARRLVGQLGWWDVFLGWVCYFCVDSGLGARVFVCVDWALAWRIVWGATIILIGLLCLISCPFPCL